MKKLIAGFSLICLISTPNFSFSGSADLVNANGRQTNQTFQTESVKAYDRRRKDFEKARKLLHGRNVPFDPNILLTRQWRKTLKLTFERMPQLQTIQRGPDRLKGVQLAHTLYLPEKVKLEGDTVILVRNLVFEGREAVIRGPFGFDLFPIDRVGLLGTSYAVAMRRISGPTKLSWTNAHESLPLVNNGRITINTSGLGRKEWLAAQQARAERRSRPVTAASYQEIINESGTNGTDGTC